MNVMKDLLVDATLTLDDCTSLYFVGNEGCGGSPVWKRSISNGYL